eukprot:3925567-Pyramimonas_sp.AAC.1
MVRFGHHRHGRKASNFSGPDTRARGEFCISERRKDLTGFSPRRFLGNGPHGPHGSYNHGTSDPPTEEDPVRPLAPMSHQLSTSIFQPQL